MIELTAPDTIVLGQPFTFAYVSETRVAGRIRLTAGTEAVSFVLEREGRPPEAGTSPRVRGRAGTFQIRDWGDHPVDSELVLRFEGAKKWLRVVAAE